MLFLVLQTRVAYSKDIPEHLATLTQSFVLRCGGLWLVELSPMDELVDSFFTDLPRSNGLVVGLVIAGWTGMFAYFQYVSARAHRREEVLNKILEGNIEELKARVMTQGAGVVTRAFCRRALLKPFPDRLLTFLTRFVLLQLSAEAKLKAEAASAKCGRVSLRCDALLPARRHLPMRLFCQGAEIRFLTKSSGNRKTSSLSSRTSFAHL